MAKFNFPPSTAGPPSRRNWYKELLDDPACNGNPIRVKEAYETHREAWRTKQVRLFSTTDTNPVSPDQALIKHLARQKRLCNGSDENETDDQEVNCCVAWARPPAIILDAIEKIQVDLVRLVGDDLYLIPRTHLHLSVIELSHRHELSQLRRTVDEIGSSRIQQILNKTSTLSTKPKLVTPTVSFDKMSIALNYLPSDADSYTYHHLRSDMHAMALESGVKLDTCPTAPSAHITIGRFVGNRFFETAETRVKFVQLIKRLNDTLKNEQGGWSVGESHGLEIQLGYLKFGRQSSKADLVGKV